MMHWSTLNDDALLQLRIRELGLTLENPQLQQCIAQLYDELDAQGLSFRPECYLGDEWCVHENNPAICIPFYLAHPRLRALEKKMMLEVEGDSDTQCMQLLRHEAGHAYMYAYKLHTRPRWKQTFGNPHEPYHDSGYRPQPYSKRYVRHLERWYAQCHPDEDFAETFAVWLNPQNNWRERYRKWPALDKLNYVEQVMSSLRGKAPRVIASKEPGAVHHLQRKLSTHYQQRRREYAHEAPDLFDSDLRTLFPPLTESTESCTAAQYLRTTRKECIARVGQWTGERKYFINTLLRAMTMRCQELKLRANPHDDATKENLLMYVSVRIMDHIHTGYYKDVS